LEAPPASEAPPALNDQMKEAEPASAEETHEEA
jgi:hypothetical protein